LGDHPGRIIKYDLKESLKYSRSYNPKSGLNNSKLFTRDDT